MTPIARAMQAFVDEADAYWSAHPERLLRLVAHEDQREDVVEALRLYESRPEAPRLLVVFRAPFESTSVYYSALCDQIAIDFERLRAQLAGRGRDLPAFVIGDTVPSGALKRAALAMHQASCLLGEGFAGIVVALVPEHVADEAAWCDSLRVLDSARRSPRVRISVFSPLGSPLAAILGEGSAFFKVASEELLGERDVHTLPGVEASTKLHALLLDASTALGAGAWLDAAAMYREARALCEAGGLREQEAEVLIALGGAYLAADSPELGVESYRHAAFVAEEADAWSLACHGWLGVGGAYVRRQKYGAAEVGFRSAVAAAKRAESVLLRIEALRLWGACLLHLDRGHEAMLTWQEAVDVGAAADVSVRDASTFYEVVEALANLLESRGLGDQARHVRRFARVPR